MQLEIARVRGIEIMLQLFVTLLIYSFFPAVFSERPIIHSDTSVLV